MKLINLAITLALGAVAILFISGCNMDPFAYAVGYSPVDNEEPYLVVRCEPGSKTLQAYEGKDITNFGTPFTTETPIQSPINGKSCSVSTENQNRPFTESDAVDRGLLARVAQPEQAASPRTAGLAATVGTLVPLLFPPVFPSSDSGKVSLNCPATLGSYLVNHVEGTVTSFNLCPTLSVRKEIPVRSNPLQLAVTPDGTTVLVTSYDSALNFIDTATDTVFTLNLPGYNPSGIAISPDGTRAFLTHYLDSAPALLVIDIPNRKLLSTIPLPFNFPRVVVLTPDGAQAWVNYYSGTLVTIVDTLSGTVSANINFGVPISMGMAFNPTGTKAFIAGSPNTIYIVDTASLSILARVAVGGDPTDVIADPNGKVVYVNSGVTSGTWLVDPINNTLAAAPQSPPSGGSQGLLIYH